MFLQRILAVLPAVWLATTASAIDFSRYHSQAEMNQYMKDLALAQPALVKAEELGVSQEGREVWYVAITKADPATAPALYVNGTHHGDEKSSTETTLALIDYLVTKQNDPAVAELLRRYVIVVQPLVNPDGHAADTREDPEGRDPNRDYSFPERDDSDSFQIPVIQLVKELSSRYHFKAAVALHSGMEGVLWPWCYTGTRAADRDLFYTLSKQAAAAMSFANYRQSYDDYPSEGEYVDYAYMRDKTLAVTIEVSNDKSPPSRQLAPVVQRAVIGILAFFKGVASLESGRLVVEATPETLQRFNPVFSRLGRKVE